MLELPQERNSAKTALGSNLRHIFSVIEVGNIKTDLKEIGFCQAGSSRREWVSGQRWLNNAANTLSFNSTPKIKSTGHVE